MDFNIIERQIKRFITKSSILYCILITSMIIGCPHDTDIIVPIPTEEALESLLSNSQGPTSIFVYSQGCSWCQSMYPILEKIAQNPEFNHVTFYHVDGEKLHAPVHFQNIVEEMIKGYPSIIFMNQGAIVDRQIGATSEDVIIQKLHKLTNGTGKKISE